MSTHKPVLKEAAQSLTEATAKPPYLFDFDPTFAPEPGESAALLSGKFGGSTLGGTLTSTALVWGSADLNIPAAVQRFMAERAGARGSREISGVPHAVEVSQPAAVAETILEAVAHVRR